MADRPPSVAVREVPEGVEFTLRLENLPPGTKTAKQMLQGSQMIVNTLKAVVETGRPGATPETASVTTRVRMGGYDDALIDAYVATGEPLDKAGGYAVQGLGSRLVAAVDGCFTNVVGLPLTTTRTLLARRGLS